MEYIEPTASSRRNLIIVLGAGFGAALLLVLFREQILASLLTKVQALPRCEGIEIFRWSVLVIVGIGIAFVASGVWLAFKLLKFDQFPLPGAWVLRRTPIRRGRMVKLRAYAILLLALVALGFGARSLYFLEKSVDRMRAHNCPTQADMLPNNALERTVRHRGLRLAAALRSWSAAQLGR